ncbi:MAG: hypothetical protein HQ481_00060 [Alphaproteobacteria bacterium]|nr:hypothetical protein [Alphaproteobacteria bacterium]
MVAAASRPFKKPRVSVMRAGAVVLIAAIALVGCRTEEQGRPVAYDKGVYQGQPDTALPEARLNDLRDRARRQHFF